MALLSTYTGGGSAAGAGGHAHAADAASCGELVGAERLRALQRGGQRGGRAAAVRLAGVHPKRASHLRVHQRLQFLSDPEQQIAVHLYFVHLQVLSPSRSAHRPERDWVLQTYLRRYMCNFRKTSELTENAFRSIYLGEVGKR